MVKVKINDNYSGFEINLGVGNVLRKGDVADVQESYELQQAIDLGQVEIVKEGKKEKKKSVDGPEVWVFSEQRGGKISQVVLELIGEAQKLAANLSVKVGTVLLCEKDTGLSKELISYGADNVYLVEDSKLKNYQTDVYMKCIVDLIKKHNPQIVIYGATHVGRDLAPRIAQNIDTGLTADCTGLDIDDDNLLIQTRPAFGGNIMAQIKCKTKPQMSTVRPGVMKMLEKDEGRKGSVIKEKVQIEDSLIKVLEVVKSAKKKVNLEEAKIIVSGGRGLCKKENFEMIKKLATLLGGDVGASRGAVDSGWIEKDHQVGQTGKTVGPKVYIACGISGAIQHRVGMQGADIIIAINKDPNAMIFSIADYGIVGDLNQVIPALINELEK